MLPGETLPMLCPELSCIYIPIFRSVAPRVCLAKVPFLALHECRKGCGLINIIKRSPGNTDSKYIWVRAFFLK